MAAKSKITIYLSPEDLSEVEATAKASDRTISYVLREAWKKSREEILSPDIEQIDALLGTLTDGSAKGRVQAVRFLMDLRKGILQERSRGRPDSAGIRSMINNLGKRK